MQRSATKHEQLSDIVKLIVQILEFKKFVKLGDLK